MKRNVFTILFCLGAIMLTSESKAQLIYYWNFNNMAPAATDTFKPSTNNGVATAHFNYHCSYIDYVTPGDALNLQPGDTAGSCIRFRNPSDSVVFFMPTTGFGNVIFSYSVMRTGSGAQNNVVSYTTDGTTFKPTSTIDAIDSSAYYVDLTFIRHSYNFSADAATHNNANFAVSIAFTNGNTNPSGNDRYDNVTLTQIIAGLQVINQAEVKPSYKLYPNPVGNILEITASAEGEKSFSVFNVIGQKVFEGSSAMQYFTINTSNLNSGVYNITIKENSTGNLNTMKFVKL